MKKFFKKIGKLIKSIPISGWITGFGFFGLQFGLYQLAKLIIMNTCGLAGCWVPKLPGDDAIPLLPIFVIPYAWSWIVWMFGGISASLTKKEHYIDWIITISTAYLIGFIIFCAVPTYMNRATDPWIIEARNKPGFFYDMWRLVIGNDGGDTNLNLFPSYHCLITACCFFAVHRQKNIPLWFRIYRFVILILICLSTVFTKQHYWIDIFGGLGIACLCYFIVNLIKPGRRIIKRREETKKLYEEACRVIK